MHLKTIAVVILLVGIATLPHATAQDKTDGGKAAVHSTAKLDRYLKANPASPLDRLSPLARQRFQESLRFRDDTLIGYDSGDLAAELTADEIRRVLAIFGEEPHEYLLTLARPALRKPAPPDAPADIERRFDTFSRVANTRSALAETDRNLSVAKAYDDLLSEYVDKASGLNDRDLELVYRAAGTNVFYNPIPKYVRDAQSLLAEMESRKLSRPSDYNYIYTALVGARLFDEARTFDARHPSADRKPLPRLHDASGLPADKPTAWMASTDHRELKREPVDMSKPVQVIVISSPGCHPSQNAARDIRNDPTLSTFFREHALWLNPPLGQSDFDAVQAWNREHPGQAMAIAYAKQEWPLFDSWATPIFHIFRNGELVETVFGWPADEGLDALTKALRKVGLLSTGTAPSTATASEA